MVKIKSKNPVVLDFPANVAVSNGSSIKQDKQGQVRTKGSVTKITQLNIIKGNSAGP